MRGRVLDPDGKPVAGATVLLSLAGPGLNEEPRPSCQRPDGRFKVSIPRGDASCRHQVVPVRHSRRHSPRIPPVGPDWWSIDVEGR